MIGAASMKKTALALLCALLLALALTACGQDAAEPSSVPSAANAGTETILAATVSASAFAY